MSLTLFLLLFILLEEPKTLSLNLFWHLILKFNRTRKKMGLNKKISGLSNLENSAIEAMESVSAIPLMISLLGSKEGKEAVMAVSEALSSRNTSKNHYSTKTENSISDIIYYWLASMESLRHIGTLKAMLELLLQSLHSKEMETCLFI